MTSFPNPPALAHALATERQLRALARTLADDSHGADDLVQHAWLRWLQRGSGGHTAGFMRKVVRNRAIDERRMRAARVQRESASARDITVPSTADVVAREQLRRHLSDAVIQLDEPYRSTLWLRFFEDLPPREIARRMAVPVETVRSRIRRALERLREELDGRYSDRSTWATLAWPLARRSSLASAAAIAGVILVHKTTVAVAALAAAVFAFWILTDDAPAEPSASPPFTVSADAGRPSRRDPLASRAVVPQRAEPPVATAPPSRVLLYAHGAPASGLDVWLHDEMPRHAGLPDFAPRAGGATPELGEPDRVTDARGWWGPLDGGGYLTVRVSDGFLVTFDLTTDSRSELRLPACSTLRVRVDAAEPDDRWRIRSYIVIDEEGDQALVARYACEIQTASGPAILFMESVEAEGTGGGDLALVTPEGQDMSVDAEGVGFAIENTEDVVRSPGVLTLRIARRMPRINVAVVDAGGAPITVGGGAFCYPVDADANRGFRLLNERLQEGRVPLTGDFVADEAYEVRVLLDDAEEFRRRVRFPPGEMVQELRLRRGEGNPRERFPLAPSTHEAGLVGVLLELGDGALISGTPSANQWLTDAAEQLTFASTGREAILTGLPDDWRGVWLSAGDGSTTRAERYDRQPRTLSSRALAPVDLEAYRRERGDGYGDFMLSLVRPSRGEERVSVFMRHTRFDPVTGELPNWGLSVPMGFEARLIMRVGREWETLPTPFAK